MVDGVGKRDPRLLRVLEAVERRYDGRVTSLGVGEVDDLVAWVFSGPVRST